MSGRAHTSARHWKTEWVRGPVDGAARPHPYWSLIGSRIGSGAYVSAPRDHLPSRLSKLLSPNDRIWICYGDVNVVALRPQVHYMARCFRDCQAQGEGLE